MNSIQWADLFPELSYQKTIDPRVFNTKWSKLNGMKVCTYFAAPVLGTAYGVDVIKPWATHSEVQEHEALVKVQEAANYYEEHGEWPTKEV